MEYQILDAEGHEIDIFDDLEVAKKRALKVEGSKIIGHGHDKVVEIDKE